MFIATYLSFYLLKSYFTAAQRLALCPFRGTGGRDWAPSRRSPGTTERHFDGINFKPRKLPENVYRETSHHDSPGALPGVGCITLALAGSARVIPVIARDALLGVFILCQTLHPKVVMSAKLFNFNNTPSLS